MTGHDFQVSAHGIRHRGGRLWKGVYSLEKANGEEVFLEVVGLDNALLEEDHLASWKINMFTRRYIFK